MKDEKKKKQEEVENQDTSEDKLEEVQLADELKSDKEALKDLGSEIDEKVADDQKQIEYLKDQLARAVAETRNIEKRYQEEKKEFIKYANRDLLLHLLPAFDMLFLAGKYVEDEGIKLTIKRIEDVFSEIGVERIKTENVQFDAAVMECVETQEGKEGVVLKELTPGFTLYGKLLTPATVVVGKKADAADS